MADNTELNVGEGGSVVRDLQEITTGIKYPVCVQVDVTTLSDGANVLNIPVAATLADALANPVSTLRGNCLYVYNGSTWDRLRGTIAEGLKVAPPTPSPGILTNDIVIANDSGGDNTLVAASMGEVIRVYKLLLQCVSIATANEVAFFFASDSDPLSPSFRFIKYSTMVLDFSGHPWYETAVGEAFKLAASENCNISGNIWYTQD